MLAEFLLKHVRNSIKRIFYNYFLRDMSTASFSLLLGLPLFVFGIAFGVSHWVDSARTGVTSSPGTVMLAALPTLSGLQLLLAFLNHDVASVPRRPIHPLLSSAKRPREADAPLERPAL